MKSQSIEAIEALWETDSKLDKTTLVEQSLDNDYLHSKYLKFFREAKQDLMETKNTYDKIYFTAREYYSGRASVEVYKKRPFDLKILKQDLDKYILSDAEVRKNKHAVDNAQLKVELLESILKQLSYRSFSIKNAIEYIKFLSGER